MTPNFSLQRGFKSLVAKFFLIACLFFFCERSLLLLTSFSFTKLIKTPQSTSFSSVICAKLDRTQSILVLLKDLVVVNGFLFLSLGLEYLPVADCEHRVYVFLRLTLFRNLRLVFVFFRPPLICWSSLSNMFCVFSSYIRHLLWLVFWLDWILFPFWTNET